MGAAGAPGAQVHSIPSTQFAANLSESRLRAAARGRFRLSLRGARSRRTKPLEGPHVRSRRGHRARRRSRRMCNEGDPPTQCPPARRAPERARPRRSRTGRPRRLCRSRPPAHSRTVRRGTSRMRVMPDVHACAGRSSRERLRENDPQAPQRLPPPRGDSEFTVVEAAIKQVLRAHSNETAIAFARRIAAQAPPLLAVMQQEPGPRELASTTLVPPQSSRSTARFRSGTSFCRTSVVVSLRSPTARPSHRRRQHRPGWIRLRPRWSGMQRRRAPTYHLPST